MADAVRVLLEERDPVRRSRAHLELGVRALDRRDLEAATEHLREAADLDPTDEQPRKLLEELAGPKTKIRRWWPF
ncbi:MAG: hypothetical protein ABMB14_19685 [Myxococcota bacterium]